MLSLRGNTSSPLFAFLFSSVCGRLRSWPQIVGQMRVPLRGSQAPGSAGSGVGGKTKTRPQRSRGGGREWPETKALSSGSEHSLGPAEPSGKQVSTPHLPLLLNSPLSRTVWGGGGPSSCQGNWLQPPGSGVTWPELVTWLAGTEGQRWVSLRLYKRRVEWSWLSRTIWRVGAAAAAPVETPYPSPCSLGWDGRQGRERRNRRGGCGRCARGFLGNVV